MILQYIFPSVRRLLAQLEEATAKITRLEAVLETETRLRLGLDTECKRLQSQLQDWARHADRYGETFGFAPKAPHPEHCACLSCFRRSQFKSGARVFDGDPIHDMNAKKVRDRLEQLMPEDLRAAEALAEAVEQAHRKQLE